MSKVVLPPLEWIPTQAFSQRHAGAKVSMVVVHRWGVSNWAGERIDGVVNYFKNPANEVSSHLIYAGEEGPDAGRCVQMVRLADKAWTEAAFNSVGVSVESSDRIWLGHDVAGLHRLARIVGWLLKHHGLPCRDLETPHSVLYGRGFTRHGALGQNGGGHLFCPVASARDPVWQTFVGLVHMEFKRDNYRKHWAR